MIDMHTLHNLPLQHATVFIRVDYNVPLHQDGTIADDSRIRASLDTLRFALSQRARVVLCSHLGRPDGTRNEAYSLRPVATRLHELLGVEVAFVSDCVGVEVEHAKQALMPGQVLLLENVRFYAQEESNDDAFARELMRGIDVYIDDAFGAIHRAHASISAVTRHVAHTGIGLLIERELHALDRVAQSQQSVIIMGGAKITDKIGMLRALAPRARAVCVGGALANSFLVARGLAIGLSRCDRESVPIAAAVLADPAIAGKMILPRYVVVGKGADATQSRVIDLHATQINVDEMILDVGLDSVNEMLQACVGADTIFWNGPIGLYENTLFSNGSRKLAHGIAATSAHTVVGGGDTEACINALVPELHFSHISTGGGASLEYLSGAPMPGLIALH